MSLAENFIEIVPIITKYQQSERKKRSIGGTNETIRFYNPEYDTSENTHKIILDGVPKFACAEPIVSGKHHRMCFLVVRESVSQRKRNLNFII